MIKLLTKKVDTVSVRYFSNEGIKISEYYWNDSLEKAKKLYAEQSGSMSSELALKLKKKNFCRPK